MIEPTIFANFQQGQAQQGPPPTPQRAHDMAGDILEKDQRELG